MKNDELGLMDRTLSDIMSAWPQTVKVFLRHGMHCVGCRVGPFHTIDDACLEYDLDEAAFLAELERAISSAPQARPSSPAGEAGAP